MKVSHIINAIPASLMITLCYSTNIFALDPNPAKLGWAAGPTAAAATGYCLAKHPYQSIDKVSGVEFTQDGYEFVSTPGIVGATRRNFVYDRSTTSADEGVKNSCKEACFEFGKIYSGSKPEILIGTPLRQKISDDTYINSGIGDMASSAVKDWDYYLSQNVVSGIWSRGNTWHESDVAQSDYCCCQVKQTELLTK